MNLTDTFHIAAAGMRSQSDRLRVVAENIANANSVALSADGDPYRRKTITFANQMDRVLGIELVRTVKIGRDQSPFQLRFEPGHPGANEEGYVRYPNVNSLVEMMDMREAQRTYQANLKVMETTRALAGRLLEVLRG